MNLTLPRKTGSGKCAYHQTGSGKTPLLFIHGVGLSADCWQPQIKEFSQQYKVFAVDLPGHGQSPAFSKKSATISDFTARIAEFIQKDISEAVIAIGHSLGALIVLELAARYPQHIRLAAVLSAVYKRDKAAQQAVLARAETLHQTDSDSREQLINQTIARWFGSETSEQAAQCRRWLQQTTPAAYAAAYQAFAEHDASRTPLSALTQPVLYLTGGSDINSTAAMSRQMAAATPQADVAIINRHAHMLQMTAAPAVNRTLSQWLNQKAAA